MTQNIPMTDIIDVDKEAQALLTKADNLLQQIKESSRQSHAALDAIDTDIAVSEEIIDATITQLETAEQEAADEIDALMLQQAEMLAEE